MLDKGRGEDEVMADVPEVIGRACCKVNGRAEIEEVLCMNLLVTTVALIEWMWSFVCVLCTRLSRCYWLDAGGPVARLCQNPKGTEQLPEDQA